MRKVLITGHRGSLGRRLNEALLSKGYEVYGVDIKDGLDCADITNLNSFRGAKVIFHLAAHLQYPKKNTMDACDTIAQFAKQEGAKVIYASSAAIYNPWSMYAIHKLYGEGVFAQLPNTMILRLFNVYGGDGFGLIDKIQKEELLKVNGNGKQRRDYVHVNDVVEAFIAAMEHDVKGVTDIGTGRSHSVNEVLRMFEYVNYEHVPRDGGVEDSIAKVDKVFPWSHTLELEDYAKTYLAQTPLS